VRTIEHLLTDLGGREITLSRDGDRLLVNAPKGAITPELSNEIRANKSAILAFLSDLDAGEETIAKAPPDQPPAISFGQQRLWFLDQLEGRAEGQSTGSAHYNIPMAIRLRGNLNRAALEKAFTAITGRHEVLRARFPAQGGEPSLLIEPVREIHLAVSDLSNQPDPEAAARDRVLGEAALGFDLANGPLFRCRLLRLAEEDHVLMVTFHHIVSDGWSGGILVQELAQLYPHYCQPGAKAEPPLPPLSIQYSDFARWQRDTLAGKRREVQLRFWENTLRGIPSLHQIPTDRPRPRVMTYRGASIPFEIDAGTSEKLRQLARRTGASLFMVLEASFATLLGRYSGQGEMVIGTPIANRNHRQLEPLIGLFVNTLVLRNDLSGDPTFGQLLARVKAQALAAYDHQDLPFEQVLERLDPERNLSYNPIFQVMFALLNTPRYRLQLPRLQLSPFDLDQQTAKFDLNLTMGETGPTITATMEYSSDLFEPSTIHRMIDHFRQLLSAIVNHPQKRLSQLRLLTAGERKDMLKTWNATTHPFTTKRNIHQLFQAQAARTPDALALVDVDPTVRYTYRELDEWSSRIAAVLRAEGVGPWTRVGLMIERSPAMIAGVYGILKAGGAYVPIDPNYPKERVSFILEDCGAPVLLTHSRYRGLLPDTEATVLCLDEPLPEVPAAPAPVESSGDHLIYIIYTSGSTGQPKGAGVYHQSFVNLVEWFIADFSLTSEDKTLLIASVSFDLTQKNMYAPLLVGGSLHLAPPSPYDPRRIAELIEARAITWVNCTPSAFYPIVEDSGPGWEKRLASLRWVFLGGEPIVMSRLLHWLEGPGCDAVIVNTYGPTECTDISHFMPLHNPAGYLDQPTPIGHPIFNVRHLILDRHLGLLPIGGQGELCLWGQSVGPGYLNDPRLAAQKFLPNPFSEQFGDRLYRTGDLVRYLDNGDVEFIGRIDHQIKVRGFRIELGEIDAALERIDGVREAVTLIRESGDTGDKDIVAYVQLEESRTTEPDFDAHLSASLPEYMVPRYLQVLPQFPLTPSGKIDRIALAQMPLPDAVEPEFTQPDGPVETQIAAIFADILKRDRVGATTSFFRLGGHSLLATRVVSRLRDQLGLDPPLQMLFEAPTVRGLAQRLASLSTSRTEPIVAVEREADLPLSFSQERLWFLYQLEGVTATYNMPMAIAIHGPFSPELLTQAYTSVVVRHETLRTIFETVGDATRLIIRAPAPQIIPVIDLASFPEEKRETVAEALRHQHGLAGFDLEMGPLHRLTCLRMATETHVLLVNMHHIVSDGWSETLFMREMIQLYHALRQGQPSPLPPLPVQYADYAVWQRRQFENGHFDKQLDYWRSQLGDEPEPLAIPTDFARPAVRTFRGAKCRAEIPLATANQLKQLAGQADATLYMALLAGFFHLLARLSGSRDLAVGTPIAGRNRSETEPLIGMFLNSLVLRARLGDEPWTFAQMLDRVKQITLEAYANQDIPFEKLLEELNPERDLSRTPLFQVFFNMLNLPEVDQSQVGDLRFEFLGNPEIGSKFDLTLYLADIPEHGIALQLSYNADLYTAERMQALLNQFTLLLTKVCRQPEVPLETLSLITDDARQVLPDPSQPLKAEWLGPVFQNLANIANKHPDRIAVQGEATAIPYRALETKSNTIAHWLRNHNVGKGDPVVIYAARNAALVPAIVGTLKAGATITLLDPAYPIDRLKHYVNAVAPKAMLALTSAGTVPQDLAMSLTLTLDGEGWSDQLEGLPQNPVPITLGPDDPACITFTSGSTGQPKGIVGRHGSLTHFMPWLIQTFPLGEEDRFSLLSGLAHDPLQRDIFTPLWLGATLCVPSAEVIGPELLSQWMADRRITIAHLTPAMARILTEQSVVEPLKSFRLAFITGDILTSRDVNRLRSVAGAITVVNFYGTTETQRAVGFSKIGPGDPIPNREAMPLGKGVADVQLLVLNGAGNLAAIGEVGEIHLRSPHLALGYLNLPQLTQERFLANPFLAEEAHSVYRTGDLGYYLPDGRVAVSGRADHQVKIRGYRIELPEIEGALAALPEVEEAVVALREPRGEDPFLVAYLQTGRGPQGEMVDKIRQELKQRLPAFMIPAAFVPLTRLPLTPNGKIDRAALRTISITASTEKKQDATTPTQEILIAIWREVLDRTDMGIHDNFFDLGGHSLNATRIITRIKASFGVLLPLRTMFEAPTIAELARRVETSRHRSHHEPPLAPRKRPEAVPLSFAQERLWFLDRLDGASSAYNMPFALKLEGPLHEGHLAEALGELVARHEILRACFQDRDGTGHLNFREPAPFPLPITHVEEAQLSQQAKDEANRPFDLERDMLIRAKLLRLNEQSHVLLLTLHHIVCDGWSLGILSNEMAALYRGLSRGEPAALPTLPLQYSDFAIWQRQWLQGEVLEAQLDFWRKQLAEAPSLLELPTDRPRPLRQTYRGARTPFVLDAPLTAQLLDLSRSQGATLFMVLEAAFALCLSRYSGTEDILIGTPVANRTRPETEKLIGLFVNTLVMRNDLSGNPSFETLLARVRQTALDAYAHQDVPFEKVIDAVKPERNLGFSPLFQVMLVFQNLPAGKQTAHELTLSRLETENVTAKFDLTLTLNQAGEAIAGLFEYNTDLFDRNTIDTLIAHWRQLLEAIAAQPQKPISQLDMTLRPLAALQERVEPVVFTHPVYRRIELQAAQTPGATALLDTHGEPLTYRQLEIRANAIAHRLRELGVQPRSIVGVALPREADLIAALLAVHKCGAAYLPLDPAYPPSRLDFMQRDAGASFLIGHNPPVASNVVCLDPRSVAQPCTHVPTISTFAEDLSHVIYTSGSTGKPKGVAITHGATAALYHWAGRTYSDHHWAGVLASTSVCFDLSFFEIFAPLASGGTVILAENALALDQHPARDRVRLINTVPSAIAELAANGAIPPSAHTINLAGEPLRRDLVQRLYQLPHVQRVYNLYGPSEDTTYSTGALIAKVEAGEPSIGKALNGTEALLLGPHLETLPARAPGLLYLGGAGLARGYLGKPGLTAQAFIPHPFGDGQRLYRTGDRAKRMRNGDLMFLGRADHQVKLRGFRIELGEIEATLSTMSKVQACAVMVIEQRLIAFVQGSSEENQSALRNALAERLPEYMIPVQWVFLQTLPHTPNGKIDRGRLVPLAKEARVRRVDNAVPPQSQTERQLHDIWRTVLGGPGFGIDDNFFEIGGDSILSLRIIARARQHGLALTTAQVFRYPTIRQLAQVVRPLESRNVDAEQGLITGDVPLTPIQRWFFAQGLKQPEHFNQSLLFALDEAIDASRLARALVRVAQHHDALRLRFALGDGLWRQFHGTGDSIQIQTIDLGAEKDPGEALTNFAGQVQTQCDLAAGPLIRAVLFQGCPAQEPGKTQRLLLVLHHLVVDGVSWRILLEDLASAYAHPEKELPAKTTSFKAWSERLSRYQLPNAERQWWQEALKAPGDPIPTISPLPQDANTNANARTVTLSLDASQSAALLGPVHRAYRTGIDDLLLTALAESVSQTFDIASFWVDLESHGRADRFDDVDLSRTVGWFTNLFPLHLEAGAGAGELAETIKTVKEHRRAVPGDGFGFGLGHWLRDELPNRPQADLLFNYLGQAGESSDGAGMFGAAGESVGPRRSPHDQRSHLLEVNAILTGGQLRVSWTYASQAFESGTITALAEAFNQSLTRLVAHCLSPEAGGYTPSDFPLAKLSQADLDPLLEGHCAIEDLYPLSPMQEGMLYHTIAAPNSGDYFEQLVLDLAGQLDRTLFEAAWQKVLARHGILRSSFHWEGLARPLQMVHQGVELPIRCEDWRILRPPIQAELWEELQASERTTGFPLDQAPAMRIVLVHLGDAKWRMMWAYHHLLLDGWSAAILFREVMTAYAFGLKGQVHSPPIAPPYRDYIAWLEAQDQQAAATFWRNQLAGFRRATPLPAVRHASPEGPRQLRPVEHKLTGEQTQQLGKWAAENGLTLNTLVQAAWGLALATYSGHEDVVFGAIVAGRPDALPDVEHMVGLFINALPVRLRTGAAELADWLKDLQANQLQREHFAYTPLVAIQSQSDIPSDQPLFESLLVFENYAAPGSAGESIDLPLEITAARQIEQTHYPLVLIAVPGDRLRLKLGFEAGKFEDADMAAVMELVTGILMAMPNQRYLMPKAWLPQLRRAIGPPTNLSENQMLIWMGQTLDPEDLSYHNLLTFTFDGTIDPERFFTAFEAVVDRSDALRTTFEPGQGTPMAVVHEPWDHQRELLDFSGEAQPQTAYRAMVEAHKQIPLDLTRSAFDSKLIQLAPDRFVWYLNLHQLIGDGEAAAAIYNQTARYYRALAAGSLPNDALPAYSDYLADETRYRTSKNYRRDLAFWQTRLAEPCEPLQFYGTPAARKTGTIHSTIHTLDTDYLDKLDTWLGSTFAGESIHQARLNFFLTALAIYLAKASGQNTVTIGLPVHNRRSKSHKQTIGSMMHVLPLRLEITPKATVGSLMKQVAKRSFECLRYGRAALANSRQNPIYDCILNYHLSRFPDFGGIPMAFDWVHPGTGHLALTLQISDFELEGGLELTFEHHVDTFSETGGDTVQSHFLQLLRACITETDRMVCTLSLHTDKERGALASFNQTGREFSDVANVPGLVQRAAAQFPNRIAVSGEHRALSYAQLMDRVQALAAQLQSEGIGAEDRVGICLGKEPDLIAAVLATLQSGAAFVPLDPNYPSDRLAFMAEDSGLKLTLCKAPYQVQFTKAKIPTLSMDTIKEKHRPIPSRAIHPNQAAYVIYTSGSTGQPKGVIVSHGAWRNAFEGWRATYDLGFGTGVHLQMAGFSFDVFAGDLARALCTGGTLVLVDKAKLLEPDRLYGTMLDHEVTHAEFVPAVLRHLADHLEKRQKDLSFMTLLAAGSDNWFAGEYQQFRRLLGPNGRLINSYGLTEATIDSSFFETNRTFADGQRSVPVGHPFPNSQLHVLDEWMMPAAIGVPGELFIGGHGLARGYLNQPAMTAARFIPSPYGHGERLYRSGDLVRHRPSDLALEFLGRIDHQTKIRGFRVEPGEIEAVIGALEGVHAVAVVVRTLPATGETVLVAHLQPETEPESREIWIKDIRQTLRSQLPDYMVPAVFDVLTALPLTPNGKIDRKSLVERPLEDLAGPPKADPPRNALESEMVALWEAVLAKQPIGIHANFFDLGGHSLSAVRLIAQCNDRFGKPLRLGDLFAYPTVAGLTAHLRGSSAHASPSQVVTLQPKGSKHPLFCIHAAGGGVFGYETLAGLGDPERPVHAICADKENPPPTVQAMAASYLELIKSRQPRGPYLLAGWSMGGLIAFEMTRQLQAAGDAVARLILIDSMLLDRQGHGAKFGEADILASFVNQLAAGTGWSLEADDLRQLPEDERLIMVQRKAAAAGILPRETELAALKTQWQLFRNNALASHRYQPEAIRGDVHLIQAKERDSRLIELPNHGWNPFCDRVIAAEVPGSHMSLVTRPHVEQLAAAIEPWLEDQP